jgi:radical SAM protein with 4Fe4S-binding SPASM domain
MHLGNIINEDYHAIFNTKLSRIYQNLTPPNQDDCEGCKYAVYCNKCFVRAATIIHDSDDTTECKWAEKVGWNDQMAKQGLA